MWIPKVCCHIGVDRFNAEGSVFSCEGELERE